MSVFSYTALVILLAKTGHFVNVSSNFNVVLPKPVRDSLRINAGQKLSVTVEGGRLVLSPIPDFESLIGRYPELRRGPSIRELRTDRRV